MPLAQVLSQEQRTQEGALSLPYPLLLSPRPFALPCGNGCSHIEVLEASGSRGSGDTQSPLPVMLMGSSGGSQQEGPGGLAAATGCTHLLFLQTSQCFSE